MEWLPCESYLALNQRNYTHLPGTAINNFIQLNLDWHDSLSVMSLSLAAVISLSFSVPPNWRLRAAVFKRRTQPHSSERSLLCSLSVWRQTVHYCCLMSSKSVNILHVLSLTTLILFHHLPTFLSTVHFLWLFHKLRVVCTFWQQCLAWFVWSTFYCKRISFFKSEGSVSFFFCATSSKCLRVRRQQTIINKLFIFNFGKACDYP